MGAGRSGVLILQPSWLGWVLQTELGELVLTGVWPRALEQRHLGSGLGLMLFNPSVWTWTGDKGPVTLSCVGQPQAGGKGCIQRDLGRLESRGDEEFLMRQQ